MDAAAWDSPAAYVVVGALVLVVVGVLVAVVAASPAHRLLGMQDGAPWWFSPAGGKTQGAVVAYLGALVAVGATVLVVAGSYVGPTLAWTLCWTSAALLLWATVTRFGKLAVHLATGGRATWDDPLESDYVQTDGAGDDVDLRAARDAARGGDWRPAAHLLAVTADADARHDRVVELATVAAVSPRWLETWLEAEPQARDALAVGVQAAVERAWLRRGTDYEVRDVEGFLAGLQEADAEATTALQVWPDDPSVLASRLAVARGLQLGKEEHERRLARLRAVAPLHRGGLGEALQFVAPKWYGSTEEMFGLARSVSWQAPAGDAVGLLVVVAHLEQYAHLLNRSQHAADSHIESPATRAELRAAAERWSSQEPSPVGRAWGHNVLAMAFWLADLPADAAPHLARTREHLLELPWGYLGDPREVHAQVQAWARARVGDVAA
ncbi:MAG: hypothetical protein IR158_02310 [Cellulomonas sp.]|uniref:hypothetical protein n=1 Tax=Cellulomonas sp. TaxID=40001 RepID=UPI0019DC6ADC|nr:hypothetical protein [Cellulomonas sp.]MBF0686587.1 hypothetical protein [Cellulomonas sp.]